MSSKAELKNLVPIRDVPAEIRKAADRAAPGVAWVVARKSVERGVDYYFVLGRETGGKRREVVYIGGPGGKVSFVRVTVSLPEVPQVAVEAVRHAYPNFRPTVARATGATLDQIVAYRLEGRTAAGRAVYLVGVRGEKIIREE